MNTLLQLLGLALVAVFAYCVWPPLPLLVVGLVLIVGAEARDLRSRRDQKGGGT